MEITYYVPAHTTNEFADGPEFARFVVTDELVNRIRDLTAAVRAGKAHRITAEWGIDWHDEDEYSLQGHWVTVLSSGDFFFNCYPEHQAGDVETGVIFMPDFMKLIKSTSKAVVFAIKGGDEMRSLLESNFLLHEHKEQAMAYARESGWDVVDNDSDDDCAIQGGI